MVLFSSLTVLPRISNPGSVKIRFKNIYNNFLIRKVVRNVKLKPLVPHDMFFIGNLYSVLACSDRNDFINECKGFVLCILPGLESNFSH